VAQREALGRDLAEEQQQHGRHGHGGEAAPGGEGLHEEPVGKRRNREVDERVPDEERREERGGVVHAPPDPAVRPRTARADPRALHAREREENRLRAGEERREAEQGDERRR